MNNNDNEEELANHPQNQEKCVKLTVKLIRNSLSDPMRSSSSDNHEIAEKLLEKNILRLDWLNIGKIENLEAFTHVTELYLQYNRIEVIENLDFHTNLTFLALGNNNIQTIENISQLSQLAFLDLSNNQISDFDIDCFPESLIIVRLSGNPCTKKKNYQKILFDNLPNLVQVDDCRRNMQDIVQEEPQEQGSIEIDDDIYNGMTRGDIKEHKRKLVDHHISKIHSRNDELEKDCKLAANLSLQKLQSKRKKMLEKAREQTKDYINNSNARTEKARNLFKTWKIENS